MINMIWKRVANEKPPQNLVVLTKIDDEKGIRNVQKMMLIGKLWYHSDGSMYVYVYYSPTHWQEIK